MSFPLLALDKVYLIEYIVNMRIYKKHPEGKLRALSVRLREREIERVEKYARRQKISRHDALQQATRIGFFFLEENVHHDIERRHEA